MAVWMLIPDRLDDDDVNPVRSLGVFAATTWAFFLAEMGDKTQIATVALGAQYEPLVAVVIGTTLGMMLANAPVVFFGDALTRRVPIRLVHAVAALIFAVLGVLALLGVGMSEAHRSSEGMWRRTLAAPGRWPPQNSLRRPGRPGRRQMN
jgi:Ca2+/H+ antiporter, TMEM165/GDT1 family